MIWIVLGRFYSILKPFFANHEKIIDFILLLICLTSVGQDINDILYGAVVKNEVQKVENLIANGADPNYIKAAGPWMKVSLLITAVNNKNLEMSKLLLENKVDVHWKDGFKTSAIIYAANSGNIDILKLLIDYGANIKDDDGQGNSVLTAAKESGNKEMISFVKSKLNN